MLGTNVKTEKAFIDGKEVYVIIDYDDNIYREDYHSSNKNNDEDTLEFDNKKEFVENDTN